MSRFVELFFRRRTAVAGLLALLLFGLLLLSPGGAAARPALQAAALAIPTIVLLLPGDASYRGQSFHRENVLGTSMELEVNTPDRVKAEACERIVLDEVARLEKILSTRDPNSEVNRPDGTPASPELTEVLGLCETYRERTGGLFDSRLGDVVSLWREAERTQTPPTLSEVHKAVEARSTARPDIDALGKAYILDRAARRAMREARVPGLLLNIGGDLLALGEGNADRGWLVGIADPANPADNARPVVRVRLRDQALATSGAYERPLHIAGETFSHILDPRTGRPASGIASASAVAKTATEANALSTALCVASPAERAALLGATPTAAVHVIDDRGSVFTTLDAACVADEKKPAEAWTKDHRLEIDVTLTKPTTGRRVKRPYLAVWIENADGKPVRTLAVWGNDRKWIKDLYDWWKFASKDPALVKSVSKATRSAGSYTLTWDGTDDAGKALPAGTYTIQVEVHREHGKHVRQTGKVECGKGKVSAELDATAETGKTLLKFGPKAAAKP